MNRDQLAQRHTAAITRWWVTMRDTGKVHPELLTDLAGIADEHARQHALSIEEGHRGEHAPVEIIPVEPKTMLRPKAPTSPPVAADLEAPPVIRLPLETVPEGTTPDRPSARTRTRGGPK
jgi:hypothetical protein